MQDSIAIVSGGLDSVTMLHYLVKKLRLNPIILSFLYGQKHAKELDAASENAAILHCPHHQVIDLSAIISIFDTSALVSPNVEIPNIDAVLGTQPITYVPNRNMIFISLAVAYAENANVRSVFYGAQQHDMYGYWDTTSTFLQRVNAVYELNLRGSVKVEAPFVTYSKTDIVRLGLELGVDYGKTWSCYEGRKLACGRCPTCAERLKAFKEIGISDPVEYELIS